ncbi:hypothetical protein [Glaciimonas sp. PCH181]|uniref:hypothetical protein n=1 Tax=Glaciimonas sp. PCH181 TaxID=2133943 RepID=UPI000D34DDD3|nr:hypothetical protein [Glaciimonas sp. PCH181]PUA16852.1 hypothetical protein C7W93_22995 [Glaciimonas sp. PCH181]
MALLTQAYILDNFGIRLNLPQLAKLLDIKEGTLRNQISARAFPIKTYIEGGRRFASYQAVSEYLDNQHLITQES